MQNPFPSSDGSNIGAPKEAGLPSGKAGWPGDQDRAPGPVGFTPSWRAPSKEGLLAPDVVRLCGDSFLSTQRMQLPPGLLRC